MGNIVIDAVNINEDGTFNVAPAGLIILNGVVTTFGGGLVQDFEEGTDATFIDDLYSAVNGGC